MTPHQKVTITRFFESGTSQMAAVGTRQISTTGGEVSSGAAGSVEGHIDMCFGFRPLLDAPVTVGVVGGYRN